MIDKIGKIRARCTYYIYKLLIISINMKFT